MTVDMASVSPEQHARELQNKIDIENKIKDGAENLLQVFDLRFTPSSASAKNDLRKQIESELDTANAKIAALHNELERVREISRSLSPIPPQYRQGTNDSWTRDLPSIPVADLETSALGLEHQSLFNPSEPGPSRMPVASTRYQVSRMQDAFGTGSPPSTNYASEIGGGRAIESAVGGLGIGFEGRTFPLSTSPTNRFTTSPQRSPSQRRLILSNSNAAEDSLDVDAEREAEDTKATRSLATALIRSLRPQETRARSGSEPTQMTVSQSNDTLASNADTSFASTATIATNTPETTTSPSALASRVARRNMARNRVAALAGANGSAHVRTPSNATGLGDETKRQIDTLNRLVNVLKRHTRVRYELPLDELVEVVMPCLSDLAGKEVRASAYRLLRHASVQPLWPLISRCKAQGLDIYLSRTLIRDNRFEAEKEQALKLIRAIMELSSLRTVNAAPDRLANELQDLIGPGVIRSMAAVAENSEDHLRHLCLETLAELAIFDVRLLIRGGGLRPTLQSLKDGPIDLAPALVQSFIYLLDMPGTREYLRPGVDLEVAISGLTESPAVKPVAYEALLRSAAKVVSVMVRSWGGLLYMCMDNKRAVRSIVEALRINPNEVKDVILDMLNELFNVRTAAQTANSGVPEQAGGKAAVQFGELGDQPRTRLNLIDHYLSLVLVIFVEAGLVDALVDVIEQSAGMTRKATLLMGELLQISKRVHPPSWGGSIHSLPQLFATAASFKAKKGDNRQAAAMALSSIDHINRQNAHHEAVSSVAAISGTRKSAARDRSNSLEESMRRGQRQVEKTKIRLGMQIDDAQFRNLMVDTQILSTKDHVRWNLDTLTEMLEGPLMNPRRLDEAMRGTKFLKRLLSFFHPFSLRFSSIRKVSSNRRFVKLGCTLLSTLICTSEGIKALAEDRLLREIRECLEQLDPLSGTSVADPLMSKKRLEETLTSGYFEMLGVLTQSVEGVRLLERFRLFTPLYHLSELRSRDDIIKAVIENVDYTIDGHTRVVLSKALTSNYRHVRLFATKHLAELIRRSMSAAATAPDFSSSEWMISLLLTQLYDPSVEVRELAVKVVEEACASIDILERVVEMRPTLDHLGDIGHPLLLKFLSTSIGFRYLWQGDYIDREMDHWFNERNQRYTIQVEVMLANAFSVYRPSVSEVDGTVPPHFYGELAKTAEGCSVLRQKGHFGEFSHFIRQHGMEYADAELITKLKSVLWAVVRTIQCLHTTDVLLTRSLTDLPACLVQGNIGSTELGLPFLEEEDVVSQIVEIAENSLVLSVRGCVRSLLATLCHT